MNKINVLSKAEKKILAVLEEGLPLTLDPFRDIAEKVNIKPSEAVKIIRSLIKNKIIRRFGATLNHRKAGFIFNAMAVWNVPADMVDEASKFMINIDRISHCYERKASGDWKYNLFTMIHGRNKQDCQAIAGNIANSCGLNDYKLLYTKEELKKSSMKYF